jgi:hypothetical protein
MRVMRLLSAVLAAVTVLLIFLFLRELLPGTPWAWSVGSLAVALQPMFGFISGGVNGDNLLYAAGAGVFLALALSFRRGLTTRRGVGVGAAAAVGVLAKITMLGILPGIALGLLLLIGRAEPADRREAWRGALAAAATLAVPVFAYMLLNSTVWDRGLFLGASGSAAVTESRPEQTIPAQASSLSHALDYLWQFYFPRLPFMSDQFDSYQLRDVWFDGFIGNFGWLDYKFAGWVYNAAIPLFLLLLALAVKELVSCWEAVRARAAELLTYAAIMIGLLVFVNLAGYVGRLDNPFGFEQARYLFPLLALYGGMIALAARGVGRRYGPAAGVLIVCIAIAHSAVAMLLTLTRYYG